MIRTFIVAQALISPALGNFGHALTENVDFAVLFQEFVVHVEAKLVKAGSLVVELIEATRG